MIITVAHLTVNMAIWWRADLEAAYIFYSQ